MTDDGLVVTAQLIIPRAELLFRASRAGGPGGQHVNTSSTRIELLWDVTHSTAITADVRQRLLAKLAARLDASGMVRVVASDRRSQLQNRGAALERLRRRLEAMTVEARPRRPTRPTWGSVQRRKEATGRTETESPAWI